jgi:hypothetical protein
MARLLCYFQIKERAVTCRIGELALFPKKSKSRPEEGKGPIQASRP